MVIYSQWRLTALSLISREVKENLLQNFQYRLPNHNKLMVSLAGGQYLTTQDSAKLVTINMHKGFHRLPLHVISITFSSQEKT